MILSQYVELLLDISLSLGLVKFVQLALAMCGGAETLVQVAFYFHSVVFKFHSVAFNFHLIAFYFRSVAFFFHSVAFYVHLVPIFLKP